MEKLWEWKKNNRGNTSSKADLSFWKQVPVISPKYGKIIVYLSKKNQIGNAYFVVVKRKNSFLSAFIEEDGREIIPFEEMMLKELFFTEDFQEICFGFELPQQSYLKYYHVTSNQNTYQVFLSTNPKDEKPLLISKMKEIDSLWLFEQANASKLENKYAFYSPREHQMITPFFAELQLVDNNPNQHFAYFCSHVLTKRKIEQSEEEIYHTSICGYLNQRGEFSSQLLDTKEKKLYNSYLFGRKSTSFQYQKFLDNLKEKYTQELLQEEQFAKETLHFLASHPDLSWESSPKEKKLAKILKFPTNQEL